MLKNLSVLLSFFLSVNCLSADMTGSTPYVFESGLTALPSSVETTLEEISIAVSFTVTRVGTFLDPVSVDVGKDASLAGTSVNLVSNGWSTKLFISKLNRSEKTLVKTFTLPFSLSVGKTYEFIVTKDVRTLKISVSNGRRVFTDDSLSYPTPFFGLLWGKPFVKHSGDSVKLIDYKLYSGTAKPDPLMAVWGDSFIEGSSLNSASDRYIAKVQSELGHSEVAIMGRGGESSSSVQNRFRSEVAWLSGARYAYIALGANDTYFPEWKANISSMIAAVKRNGMIPILATLAPRADRMDFIRDANAWIRTAKATGLVKHVVDLASIVSTSNGEWRQGMDLPDHVHPTRQAHQLIFQEFKRVVPDLF